MRLIAVSTLLLGITASLAAGPPDRIPRQWNTRQTRVIPGTLHHSADASSDRGAADPKMQMDYMLVLFKPSVSQQADLDSLLADQQNPASPDFHKWLTPEEFGNRFGLSENDHSKVIAWLQSEGFTVNQSARARNWVAFTGTAGQVSKSLHTAIHRFQVAGEPHFANTTEPAVPEAFADVISGFLGLNDFRLNSMARLNGPLPENNNGSSHFLAPADYGVIYNINPLYQQGIDGNGEGIAIVGQSDVLLSDLRAFRTRFNLPANDPKLINYNGIDPGFNGAQLEGNLDLEWAGAIAPKATIYYVYGSNAITAIVSAVNLNLAPVISISYGACEVDYAASYYRSFGQQANAQGITVLSASGDSGAAGCDPQGVLPAAAKGQAVDFPAVLPEVTAVGGTQFVEGSGSFWGPANSPNGDSALSYIPEAVWNESAAVGLLSSGGGASVYYPKPSWQNGPGVPGDAVRHVPDIALSSAAHDGYLVAYNGAFVPVSGTSASAPSMAGVVALLNHYQLVNQFQKKPGLGNINPQLYRLAQSAPSVFHDIAAGDNVVPCAQATQDCLTGSYGYAAAPGYDMATGLGSVDANALVTQWNTNTNAAAVTLSTNASTVTVNDSVQATVTVAAGTGSGTPTGTVEFSANGIAFGSTALASVDGRQIATLTFPSYRLGTGLFTLAVQYSGDVAFSGGGATANIRVTAPTGAAGIVLSGPYTVWPQPADAQGFSWQTTVTLREVAGIPAVVTGFTIDGQPQPLTQYFPSPDISSNGSVTVNLVFRSLAAPVTRSFAFTGIDANGNAWSREIAISFVGLPTYNFFSLSATPLTIYQNVSADPSCQWAVQLNVDDQGGYLSLISGLFAGGVSLSSQIPAIFGTTRLSSWAGLQGKLCFGGITPPATDSIELALSNGNTQSISVLFAGPPSGVPARLTTTPASVSIAAAPGKTGQASMTVNTSTTAQPWTISVFPANRTTAWLSVSRMAGAGTTQLTLTANGTGYEPGVYGATVTIESDSAIPQVINVPVILVLGGNASGMTIGAAGNSFSGQNTASPGMLLSVFGTNLSNSTLSATTNPLPFTLAGVSATVNGFAAPVLYSSPTQINIQIPLEVGIGPAVLGVNNNGTIAGVPIQITAAAPAIVADASQNLLPQTTALPGAYASLYMTGAGEVTPAEKSAYAPAVSASAASLPKPVLPLTVTVGGVQAFVQFSGLVRGAPGVVQVNFIVPSSVPAGVQPVVVTVGGIASPAAQITVQAN